MPGRQRRDGGSGPAGQNGPNSGDNSNARGDNRGGGRDRRDGGRGGNAAEKSQFIERVVTINRVSKVVKGGRRFSFTALVIVGDGNGLVGVGYGKAKEVPAAIQKGVEEARKSFFRVPMITNTITHPVQGEAAAGIVMLRPASPVPVLSPVALCAPCWSALVSRTSCRSRSVATTPSTSCMRPLLRSRVCSVPRKLRLAAASPSKRLHPPACFALAHRLLGV